MIIDQLFTQPIFEDAPMASPEQIAYNQLRAQWEGYQKMTSGGGNTAVSRDPAHAAKLATVPTELARMAAALKAKGIDAEAEYEAIGGPKAAPVDANQAYGGVSEVAPPGAKAERMVKHIKAGYARDGKLTPKEKGIAFATAWKAHNAGQVEEQDMAEGVVDTVKKIGKKLIKPVEDPILNQMKDIHNTAHKREIAAQNKKYAPKDVTEAEKNPHTSALGRALYRDLSKEKKASPQQVQRNKERWAQRQAEREPGVAEGGPFSYGAKKPRKGSVADLAAKKRQEQEKSKQPIEPKDQMVGVAKVTKGVAEGSEKAHGWKIGKMYRGSNEPFEVVYVDATDEKTALAKAHHSLKPNHMQILTVLRKPQGVAEGLEQKMSVKDTLAYLQKVMGTASHEDWRNHIVNTNEYFVLKEVPVSSLKSDLSGLNKDNVEKYKQMDFSKAPPIVIGSDGNILDGYHRVNVAKALRVPTLKAWVGVKKQGVADGSETAAEIDKEIEFHKLGQAAAQYKGWMNKMHAKKIRDLEAKKAALKQGVAEGEIERQHGDIKPWAYWSFPERVAKKLYQIHKGQPIGKTAIVQLWKTDGPDRMTKFMFKPDVSAILSAYQQMSEQGPLFKPGVAEGSVNDYFKRRKDEEDRIAGTKAPAKRTPKQTDYEKKRKEQGVAEGKTSTPAIYVKGGGKYPGMTIAPKGWTLITDIKDEGDSYFVMVGNDGDGLTIPKDKVSPHQIKLKNGMPITAKQAFMMFNGWTPDGEQGAADMLTRAVRDSHKKKDVKESDTLMLKLKRALIKEGRVKELADDLKTMADADFMKKYGKAKAAIRKDMNKLDEAPINELSTNKLAQYKTAAAKDAQTADKAGDVKRGDKRFSGIVKATKKQFDNDAKKVDESRAARRALMAQIVNSR